MNRSNVGNVVTNGTQILSVGATTASRLFKGKADSALNNMSKEQQSDYFKMKANKMIDETEAYNTKDSNQNNDSIGLNDIDSMMSGLGLESNSEQVSAIEQKVSNDVDFVNKWTKNFSDKFTKVENLIDRKDGE